MIPVTTVIAVLITLFVSLILPVIVYIVYGVKNKGKGVWTAWLLGAAGFFVFQVILRMPILNVLSVVPGFTDFVTTHYVWYCLILALTAALFEVAGRYIVAKIIGKKLSPERSIAAGLGHGGIEAMVIVGMTYVNNIIYILMINTGAFDGMIEQIAAMGLDTAPYLGIKETFLTTAPGTFLLGGYERILTMLLHVALTMLVCYFVSRKKDILGIVICVLIHWMVDFVAPLVNGMATEYMGNMISANVSYVIVYSFLTVVAVASVLVTIWLKRKWTAAPIQQ
ncbi:MAG: YhfC family intramembrane metalloprotease [Lachnospiraceae bacterium]|nr:YhfC family intramembrane metalloprotease [Lachnospiraceae bacterium]